MISFLQREVWLTETIAKCDRVNVLDAAFVDAYIAATGARAQLMHYGASRCPTLGRDLSKLHANGRLVRYRVALPSDLCESMGFPRWVYSYELAQ